jgi:hypothetical protein
MKPDTQVKPDVLVGLKSMCLAAKTDADFGLHLG